MKKINIIRKTDEFEKIINYRHHYVNKYFIIYIKLKANNYHRFGISVPKKVGKSVLRNKIKRQVKSIIDQNNKINKTLDYVIIVKKEILNLEYIDIKNELDMLLDKINGACKNEKI